MGGGGRKVGISKVGIEQGLSKVGKEMGQRKGRQRKKNGGGMAVRQTL